VILLSAQERLRVADWFLPERPGRLVGMHILKTGNGAIFADQWPDPRALLAHTANSYVLLGEAQALAEDDLRAHISGSVVAGPAWVPRLQAAFPNLQVAEKTVWVLSQAPAIPPIKDGLVRPLGLADVDFLWGLGPQSFWITRSWGGPPGLAAGGRAVRNRAWGAFVDGRLAAVACSYYLGECYEDVAVTTEPELRGRGLSTACAAAACCQILSDGRQPIWNVDLDNPPSLRVAEKLGFAVYNKYPLYYCR